MPCSHLTNGKTVFDQHETNMEMQRMRSHLHNTHQHQRCDMPRLHQTEKGQTAMDAIRHNTITGIVAMTLMVGACTGTTETTQPAATIAPVYTYADQYGPQAQAIAELAAYLQTVTTTVAPRRTPAPATNFDWDTLAACETGGNWSANTGNGYGGGLQFAHTARWSTWRAYGGEQYAPHPWQASREQQIDVGERVLESSGFGAWPGCSRKNGWL